MAVVGVVIVVVVVVVIVAAAATAGSLRWDSSCLNRSDFELNELVGYLKGMSPSQCGETMTKFV